MATDLERLQLRIEANTKGVENALRVLNKNLDARFKDMEKRTSGFEKHLSNVGRSAMGVFATLGAGLGATQLAQGLTATAVEMDRVNKALVVATGSSAAAKTEFEFVRQTANALGLELMSTAQQYAFLAAAAKGTALEGQAIRDIFTGVATASSSLGLSAADTAGVLNAVQQMISKGVVSAEELRGQMGERLPGAFAAAARAMNMTEQELGKALETGQILAVDLLPKLAAELLKMGNAAGAGTQSEINRLKNAWTELGLAITETGSIDVAVGVLQGLANMARDAGGALKDLAKDWADYQAKQNQEVYRKHLGAPGPNGMRVGTVATMEDGMGTDRFRSALGSVGNTALGFLAKQAKPESVGQVTTPRPSFSGGGRSGSAGALSEAQRKAEVIKDTLSSAEQRARALADDRTEQKLANAFIVNQQVWDEQKAAALEVRDAYQQLGEMAFDALDGIINKGEDAGQVIGRLLLKLAEMIAIQSITGQGAFSGVWGDIFGRAGGGRVNESQPYLVGEQGPELFVPPSAGQIMPRGRFGGGGTVINLNSVVHAPGANPSTLALMNQMLSARDAQLRREIPSLMTDQKRRGALSGAFA